MKILSILLIPYILSKATILESNLESSILKELQSLQELTKELNSLDKINSRLLTVDIDELSAYIFTQSNINGTRVSFVDANQTAEISSFNKEHQTVVYIHGWLDTIETNYTVLLRDSLLNARDLNVIIIDWDDCANSINYITSWSCVEGTGNYLGQFLTTIRDTYNYSLNYVTIVGHSLGAHIGGFAGKYTDGTLAAIVGLDPAAPLFFENLRDYRLNEDDAKYVQAVHTAANFLGVNYNVGDVDFWPNNGHAQPGCGIDAFGQYSHLRAIAYYAESLMDNNFVARQCDSYDDFENGTCNDNIQSYMAGIDLDTTLTGDFYLKTNSASPYGTGNV